MKNFSSMDQDYDLWALLSQTRHAIFKVRQRELNRYNISARQALVLFIIEATGEKTTPAVIAKWLLLESHSVSELLSRTEKEGLVRKVKDLGRKNQLRVVLTEKGRKAYHQSTKRESIHKIMSSLSEEQRQQLRSCLETLRDKTLEELGVKQAIPFPPSL